MPGLSFAVALILAKGATGALPPPGESCAARAGAVGAAGINLPAAIAGSTLRKVDAIDKLRKREKSGALIVIEGGDFTGWDFRKTSIANLCFRSSKLAGSDWRGVRAPGIGFIDTDLTGAQMQASALPGILFRTTTLAKVDASKADFRAGQIDGGWSASLAGLKIDGANFSDFRFACGVTETDGCPFDRQGISANATDFSGARFENFALWDAALHDARFDGAEMAADDVGQIVGATVPAIVIVRSGWRKVEIPGTAIAGLARIFASAAPVQAAPVQVAPVAALVKSARAAAPLPGGYLFLRSTVSIPPTAAADPAWPRVVDILTRLSPAYVLARVGTDRRVALRGKASASATAACTIDTVALTLYAGAYAMAAPVPPGGKRRALASPPIPIVRIGNGIATIDPAQDTSPGIVRVARCTGAAPFGPMKMVPVDDLTFEALWSAAGRAPE